MQFTVIAGLLLIMKNQTSLPNQPREKSIYGDKFTARLTRHFSAAKKKALSGQVIRQATSLSAAEKELAVKIHAAALGR